MTVKFAVCKSSARTKADFINSNYYWKRIFSSNIVTFYWYFEDNNLAFRAYWCALAFRNATECFIPNARIKRTLLNFTRNVRKATFILLFLSAFTFPFYKVIYSSSKKFLSIFETPNSFYMVKALNTRLWFDYSRN